MVAPAPRPRQQREERQLDADPLAERWAAYWDVLELWRRLRRDTRS
jgi:hypothetical protein